MKAISPCSSSFLSLHSRKMLSGRLNRTLRGRRLVMSAGRESQQWNHSGQLVDESLIVLRKRVHDLKIIERNYEPPEDWTKWEKKYYTSYNEFICKFVGILQSRLMNTKPSMALGMLALLTMSLQASTVIVLVYLTQAANGVLSTIHFY